ncbi:hypothetical protein [Flavobacterium subsaxonicum]|nr:hypothetical protein [Flavobacterium subsaxonicum]
MLLIALCLAGCNSAKTNFIYSLTCGTSLEVQHETDKKQGYYKKSKHNDITFIFLSEFINDNIEVFVNDKLFFSKENIVQKTNDLSAYFNYDYSNLDTMPIIKIKSKQNESCCDFVLQKGYRIAYIFYYQEKWIIRYSNIEYALY